MGFIDCPNIASSSIVETQDVAPLQGYSVILAEIFQLDPQVGMGFEFVFQVGGLAVFAFEGYFHNVRVFFVMDRKVVGVGELVYSLLLGVWVYQAKAPDREKLTYVRAVDALFCVRPVSANEA